MAIITQLSFYQKLERIPLLKIVTVYVLGLFIAPMLKFSFFGFQYLQHSLLVLSAIIVCCYLFKGALFKYGYLIGYYTLVLLFGIWQFWRSDPLYTENHFSHFHLDSYVVEIAQEPSTKASILRFSAKVIGGYDQGRFIATTGKAMISMNFTAKSQLRYADRLLVKRNMSTVPPPFNPLEFDYRQYLKRLDIYHQIFLRTGDYIMVAKRDSQSMALTGMALRTREHFLKKLRRYCKKEEYYAIAAALLYGFRSEIDEGSIKAFTNTGTVHVLSVSGMHVAVLFGFLMLMFRYIPWPLMLNWLPVVITFS